MSRKIKRLYQEAGLKPPKGKGIHTEKFHSCVVDVSRKIEAGKLPPGSSAHAICMASLGPERAVKPGHRRSKATKALMSEAMLLEGEPGVRRTRQGHSKLRLLNDGLLARHETLVKEKKYYIAEIVGYADAMKRESWDYSFCRKLIEHANELAEILDELDNIERQRKKIGAELDYLRSGGTVPDLEAGPKL